MKLKYQKVISTETKGNLFNKQEVEVLNEIEGLTDGKVYEVIYVPGSYMRSEHIVVFDDNKEWSYIYEEDYPIDILDFFEPVD